MTLARLDIFGLLACPLCSYLRAEHPELVNDALALPVLWQGRAATALALDITQTCQA